MPLKPAIYIPVEIKARELEGKLLVALEAARKGFRVVIGNQDHLKKLIKKGILSPGIYFYKNLSPGKEKDLGLIRDQGYHIVSQDEESGLLDFSYDKFISFRSCNDAVALTSQIYCWGAHDHQSWATKYSDSAEKIIATGSPRVDYWRQDFLPYYEACVSSLEKKYGDFVLIPSNFPLGNGYMSLEQRMQQGKVNGSINSPEDEEALIESVRDTKKMFRHFVSLISYLAVTFPGLNFVVRPHPVEKLSEWERSMAGLPNVHVIFEGSVSKWVRASRAVLHNGCTTGIEARFSGVPAIAYAPFVSSINREVPNAVSLEYSSQEAVAAAVEGVIHGSANKHVDQVGESLLADRFANFEGEPAYQRIVTELDKLDVVPSPPPKFGFMVAKYIKRYEINRFFKRLAGKDDHGIRKFPGLEKEELESMQRRLCSVRPELSEGKIRKYIGDIYIVEN